MTSSDIKRHTPTAGADERAHVTDGDCWCDPERETVGVTADVTARYSGREEWWLTLIKEAEMNERMWSDDAAPSALRVAERIVEMLDSE